MNDNVAFEICLGSGEWELNNTDFSAFDSGGTTCEVRCLLVDENQTVNQFRIINSASKLSCNMNVV